MNIKTRMDKVDILFSLTVANWIDTRKDMAEQYSIPKFSLKTN